MGMCTLAFSLLVIDMHKVYLYICITILYIILIGLIIVCVIIMLSICLFTLVL